MRTDFISTQEARFNLFCIPYAGGSAAIYNSWNKILDPAIKLCPIELAGRGKRTNEPFSVSIDEAVDDIIDNIKAKLYDLPYAFFGHSLGAMLSYELANKIKLMNMPEPKHVFFSGRGAPHIEDKIPKNFHLMDDDEFKIEVLKLGGTHPDVFENKDLFDFIMPMLKNDFRLASLSSCDRVFDRFDFDITVLIGKSEELHPEQIAGWKMHTNSLCRIQYFNGGHFFINNESKQITKLINSTLLGSN